MIVRLTLFILTICWLGGFSAFPPVALAGSAIDLLSGFDAQRIESAYPPDDENSLGELAKLVFRIRKVSAKALEAKIGDPQGDAEVAKLGNAARFDGTLRKISVRDVPKSLVEFLELESLRLIEVEVADSPTDSRNGPVMRPMLQVVTANLPDGAQEGDRVVGSGVVIEVDQDAVAAIAVAHVAWFPKTPPSAGWDLLSRAGMDVSLLADVASRNRKPLMAADGDAFYTMLAAAAEISQPPALDPQLPAPIQPEPADPAALLSNPKKLCGHWMTMELETVQVTRITVTEPHRRSQLGSDHYFQIDAVGDLGNVVVEIERADGSERAPAARFENRYPVSVVVRELPKFLSDRITAESGEHAVVSEIKLSVGMEGFFYRLWSYKTDFMKRFGSGDQFGPLLVASRLENLEPTSTDPAGVGVIGWIAGIGILAGIFATWLWHQRVTASDDEVREKRKERESQETNF